MVVKSYKKLWMIKRLKQHGANLNDLTDVFIKHARSILEFGAPVWTSGLTKVESEEIERVQKSFLHIALGENYCNYEDALKTTNLESLEERRILLCTKFAKKSAQHPKHKTWFQPNKVILSTRSAKPELKVPLHRLTRFRDSPVPFLTKLLNIR